MFLENRPRLDIDPMDLALAVDGDSLGADAACDCAAKPLGRQLEDPTAHHGWQETDR